MANGEHLLEVRAVGVAVEIDRADIEHLEDGGQIVGGVSRAIERRALAERVAAAPDEIHRPPRRALQRRAVDGTRFAGAAVVHEDEIACCAQRPEQSEIVRARLGRRIPGTAFGGDQGPGGRTGGGMRVELEIDRDAAADRTGRIERSLDAAAISRLVGAALERHASKALESVGSRRRMPAARG